MSVRQVENRSDHRKMTTRDWSVMDTRYVWGNTKIYMVRAIVAISQLKLEIRIAIDIRAREWNDCHRSFIGSIDL